MPRIVLAAWFVSVALMPRTLARWLIALRFVVADRPAWFEQLLTNVMKLDWRHMRKKERAVVP